MKIRDWFKSKFTDGNVKTEKETKTKSFKFGEFTINDKNLNLFEFNVNEKRDIDEKAKYDKSLLEDIEIKSFLEEYDKDMNTDEGKILQAKLTDFPIKAIMVENLSYGSYGDFKNTLEVNTAELICKFRHPSVLFTDLFNDLKLKSNNINLYTYLKLFGRTILNFDEIRYKPNEYFSIKHRPDLELDQNNTNNKEITFISSINYEDKKEIGDSKLYVSPNMFRKKSSAFKGIVVQNLSLNDNISNELNDLDKIFEAFCINTPEDSDVFAQIAFDLYEKTNGKISFISQIDDIIVIKGIDEDEKRIYSTLYEVELPDILKSMPRYTGDNKNKISQGNSRRINEFEKEEEQYT